MLTVCSVQLNCALFSKSGNFQVSPLGGGRELGDSAGKSDGAPLWDN